MGMDFDTIKRMAKEYGMKTSDLIALAPANDPFYTGRPAEVAAAEWFTNIYHGYGYTTGVHLRRIHYRLVSQRTPVAMPNGLPYENTTKCWGWLVNAGKYARYLNLVPADNFVDRRNPDAIVNARFPAPGDFAYENPAPGIRVDSGTWDSVYLPPLPELDTLGWMPDRPSANATGYTGVQQDYLVEVWSEKTTMNDILEPLCQRYNVNLVTGAGELSITAVIEFLQRVEAAGRPARILYVSDYDPAGVGMPISVSRKIEYYQRNYGMDHLDIRLEPIVLTKAQVEDYGLPQVPVKVTDRRKANFERDHGGATELDALEALFPGHLAGIVEEAVQGYVDLSLANRAYSAKCELGWHLSGLEDEVAEVYADEIEGVEEAFAKVEQNFDATRHEFNELVAQFQERIDAHQVELDAVVAAGEELWAKLANELRARSDAVNINKVAPLPTPNLQYEGVDQLYASERDYFDQLERYKNYRHGRD